MGEIAEMMLDGTLCEGCGVYMGAGDGLPRYCSKECARGRGALDCTPTPRNPASNRSKKRAARQFKQAVAERKAKGLLGNGEK